VNAAVILLVAPETSGELSDWHLSRMTAVRVNESRSTLFVLADEKPSEVGGRIYPVREVARNGWYLLLCLVASLMCPHLTGDCGLIFRAKTSPALERGRRKRVIVFRDLTPYSLVFHDVSKESDAFYLPGLKCLGPLKVEALCSSKTLGNVTQRHSVTSQQIWILNAVVETSRNCADVRNNSGVEGRLMSVT
jgi:hypothetical protein